MFHMNVFVQLCTVLTDHTSRIQYSEVVSIEIPYICMCVCVRERERESVCSEISYFKMNTIMMYPMYQYVLVFI